MKKILETGLCTLGITPPPHAIAQLIRYSELLLEQNKVMNLTAITNPADVARLHFLDSAALVSALDLKQKRVIDIGTGGGFPGVVLKILEPTIELTLLDGLGKRVTFLQNLCQTLGLTGTSCIHARAEVLAHDPHYREQFDVATSRAVAALPILCELCLPYVKPGGAFLAMKSTREEETVENPPLGDGMAEKIDYQIPETDILHRIIRIPKVKNTPKEYPRRWSKIKKVKI